MQVIKYIGQILAAAVMAFVITWLMTRLMGWIFSWLLGLSNFWMLVVLLLGESIIVGIMVDAASSLSIPFAFTNYENIVAVIVSALITLGQTILWIISVCELPHQGFIPFITWLFVLVTVAFMGIELIIIEITCYNAIDN